MKRISIIVGVVAPGQAQVQKLEAALRKLIGCANEASIQVWVLCSFMRGDVLQSIFWIAHYDWVDGVCFENISMIG